MREGEYPYCRAEVVLTPLDEDGEPIESQTMRIKGGKVMPYWAENMSDCNVLSLTFTPDKDGQHIVIEAPSA